MFKILFFMQTVSLFVVLWGVVLGARAKEVKVEFVLRSRERVKEAISTEDSRTIRDSAGIYEEEGSSGIWSRIPEKILAETLKFDLLMIKDRARFAQFKALWKEEEEEVPSGSRATQLFWKVLARLRALWGGGEGMSAEEFAEFFKAADFLGLSGEARKHFAANMVRGGLLGAHSQEIVSSSPYREVWEWEISWRMLVAFAGETGMRMRVGDGKGGEGVEVRFYPGDSWEAEEYGRDAGELEERPEKIEKVWLRCRIQADTGEGGAEPCSGVWLASVPHSHFVSVCAPQAHA
ncbi:MAG: hypothetical protein MRJ68_18085 [Nitrospira sp.]|nr:hypothetical protein [Nitrospira sp.]